MITGPVSLSRRTSPDVGVGLAADHRLAAAEQRATRRSIGSGGSALLATGTVDRSAFALGILMPGASAIAWGCSSDFA
jgi:hypothetical protein